MRKLKGKVVEFAGDTWVIIKATAESYTLLSLSNGREITI